MVNVKKMSVVKIKLKIRNCEPKNLDNILSELYKRLVVPLYLPEIILILSRYGFESTFAVDQEIHTVACMIELMSLPISFKSSGLFRSPL